MKFSTTFLLFLVAAGLGAYVYMVEIYLPGTRRLTSEPPLQFSTEDAGAISIARAGETILLRKNDESRWSIERPVEDRANQEACAKLLEQLNTFVVREIIGAAEVATGGIDLAELGLTPGEGVALTVFDNEGAVASVLVGNDGAIEGTTYVTFPENPHFPHVYLVETELDTLGARTLSAFRDPKIFPLTPSEVGRLVVKNGDTEVELFLDPRLGLWKLGKPLQSRAGQATVEELVKKICALETTGVIESSDDPAAAEFGARSITAWRLDPESLAPPSADDEPAVTCEIAVVPASGDEEKPRALGRISGRDGILRLPDELEKIVDANPNDYRDPYLAQIPEKAITGIIIQTRDNSDLIITNNGRQWLSLRNGAWETASQGRVRQFLGALNKEEVIDFVADTSANLEEFELAPPAIRIGLTTSRKVTLPGIAPEAGVTSPPGETPDYLRDDDALNYVVAFGKVVSGENNDVERLYAQFGGEPFVVSIDPAFLGKIPIHPVKWKDLGVLGFNIISLREVAIRREGDEEPVRLAYDHLQNTWKSARGESDLTGELDVQKAHALAEALGSLTARDWLVNREAAYRTLEKPAVTVEVVIASIGDDGLTETEKSVTLAFAPATEAGDDSSPLHYGRLDDSLDIFLIEDKTLQTFLAPLIKEP